MLTDDTRAAALRKASTPVPQSLFAELITSNHILHAQNVVDAYGHVSVRSPQNDGTFFMAKRLAPALVATRADIEEYTVEAASLVHPPGDSDGDSSSNSSIGYVERFIHSEIYKRYPGVHSVVHAHSEPVLPFSITSAPLRPVFHLGGTLGPQPPVYDIALHATSARPHDLLVATPALGNSLAAAFNPAPTTMHKASNLIRNYLTASALSTAAAPVHFPPSPVVLMRGHGFTAVGSSLRDAVSRAVYTVANARVQTAALLMQGGYNLGLVAEHFGHWEGAKDGHGGGPKGSAKQEGLRYLSEKEVKDSAEASRAGLDRCWALWSAEVRDRTLYRNELLDEEEGGGEEDDAE